MLVAIGVLAAACGGDAGEITTTTSGPSTTTTVVPTTTADPRTTTTTMAATTSTAAPTTTLPGEPIDFGPADGDVLMVIGVAHDDVLNLRAAPGADRPILAGIPPTYDRLVAEGDTRDLSPGFWIEVDYDGTVGWVSLSFVAYEGAVTDQTSTVVSELGERPSEQTMTELAEVVAEVFDSDEEPESDIVQVTTASSGDLAEITYDVIGLGDDSVRGFRLHVFAEESANGLTLRSVEVTTLCGRGVTDDGLCT